MLWSLLGCVTSVCALSSILALVASQDDGQGHLDLLLFKLLLFAMNQDVLCLSSAIVVVLHRGSISLPGTKESIVVWDQDPPKQEYILQLWNIYWKDKYTMTTTDLRKHDIAIFHPSCTLFSLCNLCYVTFPTKLHCQTVLRCFYLYINLIEQDHLRWI